MTWAHELVWTWWWVVSVPAGNWTLVFSYANLSFGGIEKELGQNSHVLCLISEYGILECRMATRLLHRVLILEIPEDVYWDRSVRTSVRMWQPVKRWTDFHEVFVLENFMNFVKNDWNLTRRLIWTTPGVAVATCWTYVLFIEAKNVSKPTL